uniref:TAR DNA-binding protein 43 n=1 Tax=Tabanus bromius TaxID=304241 RepID=A0A0K8TS76_TABBR
MSIEYLQVAEEEGDEPIELPLEEDGTLLISTLQAQFPCACGLKYRSPETKALRGVRLNEGRFHPPSNESGWGNERFFCVFPKENKRKSDDNLENSTAKTKRIETKQRCTDLICLGLPYKATEQSLRDYFGQYGEVLMAEVKKDTKTGQSKGFGFIRFSSYEVQMRVLVKRHLIDGRWCEVKIPNSKEGVVHQVPCKVFVGRCTEDITADDLKEYFSKFGEVTDVFIPKPFRAFSFVTFLDPEIAQSLCGEDHIIKGVSVHVSTAAPKSDQNRHSNQNMNSQNHRGGGNQNRQNNPSYSNQRDGYMNSGPVQRPSPWNNQSRSNLDMPNLQALGINPQGQNPSSQGQNLNNPLGVGLNLPVNPAIVAAALNHWGMIGNLQNQDQGFNGPSNPNSGNSSNQPSGSFLSWMAQNGGGNNDNQQAPNKSWARQPSGAPPVQVSEGKQNFL